MLLSELFFTYNKIVSYFFPDDLITSLTFFLFFLIPVPDSYMNKEVLNYYKNNSKRNSFHFFNVMVILSYSIILKEIFLYKFCRKTFSL